MRFPNHFLLFETIIITASDISMHTPRVTKLFYYITISFKIMSFRIIFFNVFFRQISLIGLFNNVGII